MAVLGAGFIAAYHARAVAALPGAELVAAANWRPESLAELARAFSIPRTSTDWRDIAADAGVDAVVIATPNNLHAEQAIACLEAKKHVMIEKPIAMNAAKADAMVAAARPGASLMVAHC